MQRTSRPDVHLAGGLPVQRVNDERQQRPTQAPPRIGLVLGAGGSVGLAFHGGVTAALAEHTGWDPRDAELVVGTSAGSITAAMLRLGLAAPDLAAISEDRPLSLQGEAIRERGQLHNPRASLRSLMRLRPAADRQAMRNGLLRPWSTNLLGLLAATLPAGVVPTDAISTGLNAVCNGDWPDRNLWICAVRLTDGRRVVFGREGAPHTAVGQAVAASCAIPTYFRPVAVGGDRYVDGGLRSMVNVDLVADLGLDTVIVSSPMSWASRWPSIGPDAAVRQLFRRQLRREMATVRRGGAHVTAFQPTDRVRMAMGVNVMDARRRHLVSREAYRSTSVFLTGTDEGRKLVARLRPEALRVTASRTGSGDEYARSSQQAERKP